MDIKTALKNNEELDPYMLYSKMPVDDLIHQLENILDDQVQLDLLRENKLYRENTYKVVNFLYLKFLNTAEEAAPSSEQGKRRKQPLKDETLERLYSLA